MSFRACLCRARAALAAAFLVAVLAAPDQVAAQSITIDDFSTSQPALTLTYPPSGTSASSSASGGGILGGERDLQINLSSGVGTGTTEKALVSAGLFFYSQDSSIAGTGVLQWDGTDGSAALNATGLGGIDLTVAGTQVAFLLKVVADDLPATLTFVVYTDAGNASAMTVNMPGSISSPTNVVLPYSAFAPTLGAGANFANVGAVTMSIGANTALDFELDFVQTIPMVMATQQVAIVNDLNGNGLANPGDTLRYTIVVSNPADVSGVAATGVMFFSGVPANTTLVPPVTTTQGTVTSGFNTTDTSLSVNLGTILDGGSATVTFDAKIDNPLPAGVFQISCQGLVTTSTLPNGVLTDDSTLPGPADVTVIPVFPLSAIEVPALNEWGFLVLIGFLLACGLGGLRKLRRRENSL